MWQPPAVPANEAERLVALEACGIMDTPPDERFDRLTRLAKRFYSADIAFLGFIDEQQQWMKSMTAEGLEPSIDRRKTVCQLMLATGKPLIVPDFRADPTFDGHPVVPNIPLRFYAGVPILLSPDLVIGSLCVMRQQPGTEHDFDIEPLQDLAAIVGDEIEMGRLNTELTVQSRMDALTGLANRRSFDEALLRAESRCRRTGEPLSLLMIDIDHFKLLNDKLGHQAGDEALQKVGAVLAGVFHRKEDTVARYGGEEFAAILPASSPEGALKMAEKIRSELRAAEIVHPTRGIVSISVGVSTQTGRAIEREKLLGEADAALYEAKRQGRDRVVAADLTLPAQ